MDMETEITERMLKTEFFGGAWDKLESKTQNLLVEVEIDSGKNQIADMVRNICLILQMELEATFLPLSVIARQTDSSLALDNMGKALEAFPATRTYIDSLKIRSEDKTFLKEQLPDYLRKVIRCQTYFGKELPRRDELVMLKESTELRKNLLGIGTKGILPQLAAIKGVLRSHK
jgi:hypothetical protein